MCRVLAYAGHPILLDDVLYRSNSSLVRQSYAPQQLRLLNLGGFGLMAWDPRSHEPERPFTYRSTQLPVFDPNLKALAQKIEATCVLAHVRGIPYDAGSGFGPQNLHPFHYPGCAWAMAHNGDLYGYNRMKADLVSQLRPEIAAQIVGTTDSEGVYALVMNELPRLDDDDPSLLVAALERALQRLRALREAHGLDLWSSLNLCFSNGRGIVALRYTLNFGCYPLDDPEAMQEGLSQYLSLWFTAGERYACSGEEWRMGGDGSRADSVLVASEPLTRDITGWVEVPEYTILCIDRRGGQSQIGLIPVAE